MSAVALMFAHSWPTTAARITRALNYAGIACPSCADPVKADDHSAVLMTASSGWGHLKPGAPDGSTWRRPSHVSAVIRDTK
jgi:hypothetical protein